MESNCIQLPRGWGEESSIMASSHLQGVKETRWELMSCIPTAGPSPGVSSSMGGLASEWDDYYCFKADIKSEIVQELLPTQTKTFTIWAGPFRGASEMKVSKITQVYMKQLELLWVMFLVFGGNAKKVKYVY